MFDTTKVNPDEVKIDPVFTALYDKIKELEEENRMLREALKEVKCTVNSIPLKKKKFKDVVHKDTSCMIPPTMQEFDFGYEYNTTFAEALNKKYKEKMMSKDSEYASMMKSVDNAIVEQAFQFFVEEGNCNRCLSLECSGSLLDFIKCGPCMKFKKWLVED